MAESAETIRDKAFILVLYESGCRIGEILTLRIRNVQFDDYGAVLIVT
jgi:integrase/recombinase XerD